MDNSEEDDNESIEKIIDELDGPNIIFNINPIKTLPDFLQAHNMKRYTYNFGKTVRLNNKNILVIHFEQKKTEEHQKSNGVIYIDEISLAIVRIEENLHIKIPAMLKPIIFAAGYKIENPWMKLLFEYREHDKIWIPSQANVKINFKMEKIKLFTKNIIAHYYVEKLFITNEIKLQNISPFPKEVCVKQNSSFKKQLPPYNEDAWKKYNSIYMRNP